MTREIFIDADTDEVVVRFPFDLALKDFVKGLAGAKFHWGTKTWRFPPGRIEQVAGALTEHGFTVYGERDSGGSVERSHLARRVGAELDAAAVTARPVAVDSEDSADRDADTFTVGRLNASISAALRDSFPQAVWVRGVLAEYDRGAHRATSWARIVEPDGNGEAVASLAIVIFPQALGRIREKLRAADFALTDGLPVRFRGRVEVYAPRGTLQLVVDDVDPAYSAGDLVLRREAVLRQIRAERLEALQLALPMPVLPRRIALITSIGSDAWHDFLSSLRVAALPVEVVPYDVRVQGADLRASVCAALSGVARDGRFDLVVITRGGGSRVDLAAWDDLDVARAVAKLPTKVLVAIGHQQDRSVLDEIAASAKTPTEAGERVVARWDEALARLERSAQELERRVRTRLEQERRFLSEATRRAELAAQSRLSRQREGVAAFAPRLRAALLARLRLERLRTQRLEPRLTTAVTRRALGVARERLSRQQARLERAVALRLRAEQLRLAALGDRVRLVHPDGILARGFALVRSADGVPVASALGLSQGQRLILEMRDGHVDAGVESVTPKPPVEVGREEER